MSFRNILRRFWARRVLRYLVIFGLLFAVFNVAAVFVTSANWFCGTCHIMKSYHASWAASEHKDVACVDCHVSPGLENLVGAKLNGLGQFVDDVLGRTSGKPTASVSNFSCMRSGCHTLQALREAPKDRGEYLFDHDKHVDLEYTGIKIQCATCHSHIKGSTHFDVNTNACVACHLIPPEGGSAAELVSLASEGTGPGLAPTAKPATKIAPSQCRKCHEPPSEPLVYQGLKVVHSEYVAYGAACEACHHHATERPKTVGDAECFSCHDFGREKDGDVVEIHRRHSEGEHKVECYRCHGVIRHGTDAQAMRLQFIDCRSCHSNQHAVQSKTYKVAVDVPSEGLTSHPTTSPPAHSQAALQPTEQTAVTPMFMAHVDCTGCHTQTRSVRHKPDSGSLVKVATPESCDRCHETGLGTAMVPMWQKNTKELYQDVSKLLAAVGDTQDPGVRQRVRDAQKLLEIIRLDGSWGVHNPRYTQKLLREARDHLSQAVTAPAGQAGE